MKIVKREIRVSNPDLQKTVRLVLTVDFTGASEGAVLEAAFRSEAIRIQSHLRRRIGSLQDGQEIVVRFGESLKDDPEEVVIQRAAKALGVTVEELVRLRKKK